MRFFVKFGEVNKPPFKVMTHFWYVSPSYSLLPLRNAPIRILKIKQNKSFVFRMRTEVIHTDSTFIIKMFNRRSPRLGGMYEEREILIEVDPYAELISIRGFSKHGGFVGRGRLITQLSEEDVKTFAFKRISPPIYQNREARKVFAEIRNNRLCLEIDLKEPLLSESGQTIVVASTAGDAVTSAEIDGTPIMIRLHAYIKK